MKGISRPTGQGGWRLGRCGDLRAHARFQRLSSDAALKAQRGSRAGRPVRAILPPLQAAAWKPASLDARGRTGAPTRHRGQCECLDFTMRDLANAAGISARRARSVAGARCCS